MATGITIDGSVLVELREDRFWSQAELAAQSCAFALAEGDRQCGISRETISKLERGSRKPGLRTLRYLVGALRPSLEDLRRLLGREPPQALADLARAEGRDLLASGSAVTATSPVDALERIAHALGQPARVSKPLLDALLGHTGRIGGAAVDIPPHALIQPAIAHLRGLERLHGCSMTPTHRQRLHAVAADAAALVSWLHWLAGHQADARNAMTVACRLARHASDDTIQARVFGLMSWISSTIPTAGQRGDTAAAVALAAQAAALGHHAPPADRAWLAERCAAEYAAAGHADACWRGMGAAQRILEGDPIYRRSGGFFATLLAAHIRRIAGTVGLCHVLLGQAQQAEAVLIRQLGEVDPSDLHYVTVLLSDLAVAYTLQDEPERASRSAIEAVSLARSGGVLLNVERVRGVRARMPDSWDDLSCIKALDEHLADGIACPTPRPRRGTAAGWYPSGGGSFA